MHLLDETRKELALRSSKLKCLEKRVKTTTANEETKPCRKERLKVGKREGQLREKT